MADNKGAQGQYSLVNAYEPAVREMVQDTMAKTDMCRCEKCYLDACAIVFNKGFTRYVTTRKGEVLASLLDMNQARQVQLRVAVTEAVDLIKKSPQHDA